MEACLQAMIDYTFEQLKSDKPSKSITFQTHTPPLSFGRNYLEPIKALSTQFPDKNIRICFHQSPSSPLHQMLIFERKDKYYPPHIHHQRDEIHYVLEGALEVHYLDIDGNPINHMLNQENSNQFTLVTSSTPHLTIPMNSYVIYLELKNGPLSEFSLECFKPELCNDLTEEQYMRYLSSKITT